MGERRFRMHITQGKFDALGTNEITFAWLKHQLSKQSANALEAAVQMLLLSKFNYSI